MAITNRDTTYLKVAMITLIETLTSVRIDADLQGITRKVKQLLRKNKLSSKGKFQTILNRLLLFFYKHPECLPTFNELKLYK